jgi:hypothetical protein
MRSACSGSITGGVLFRGASRTSYDLRPSLARAVHDPSGSREILYGQEFHAYRSFRKEARHFLEPNLYSELRDEDHPLLWLTAMQHYGAPTRLLDWTKSPYVALYFASEKDAEHDGVVWFWQTGLTEQAQNSSDQAASFSDFEKAITSQDAELSSSVLLSAAREAEVPTTFISPLVTTVTTRRITAQTGAFSLSNRPDADHGTVIEGIIARSTTPCLRAFGRITIDREAKIHMPV